MGSIKVPILTTSRAACHERHTRTKSWNQPLSVSSRVPHFQENQTLTRSGCLLNACGEVATCVAFLPHKQRCHATKA